jgi:hypothetical protein
MSNLIVMGPECFLFYIMMVSNLNQHLCFSLDFITFRFNVKEEKHEHILSNMTEAVQWEPS